MSAWPAFLSFSFSKFSILIPGIFFPNNVSVLEEGFTQLWKWCSLECLVILIWQFTMNPLTLFCAYLNRLISNFLRNFDNKKIDWQSLNCFLQGDGTYETRRIGKAICSFCGFVGDDILRLSPTGTVSPRCLLLLVHKNSQSPYFRSCLLQVNLRTY